MAYKRLDPPDGDPCYDGETCPGVFEREEDLGVVVQGYATSSGRPEVRLPAPMLARAVRRLTPASSTVIGGGTVRLIADGMALVCGVPISREEFKVPDGEAAVLISRDALVSATEGWPTDGDS